MRSISVTLQTIVKTQKSPEAPFSTRITSLPMHTVNLRIIVGKIHLAKVKVTSGLTVRKTGLIFRVNLCTSSLIWAHMQTQQLLLPQTPYLCAIWASLVRNTWEMTQYQLPSLSNKIKHRLSKCSTSTHSIRLVTISISTWDRRVNLPSSLLLKIMVLSI